MKSKNGLKRMTMTKGEDITFSELQKRYLKKCMVNNLSEYTIKFYETSCKTAWQLPVSDKVLSPLLDKLLNYTALYGQFFSPFAMVTRVTRFYYSKQYKNSYILQGWIIIKSYPPKLVTLSLFKGLLVFDNSPWSIVKPTMKEGRSKIAEDPFIARIESTALSILRRLLWSRHMH